MLFISLNDESVSPVTMLRRTRRDDDLRGKVREKVNVAHFKSSHNLPGWAKEH